MLDRMQPAQTLYVRVPASTSNLGPGFDFLGLAFGLFLDAEATPDLSRGIGDHRVDHVAPTGPGLGWTGGSPGWSPSDDLVLRSLAAFESRAGRLPALNLRVRSEIPVGRGFGSSGAAVAAALLLANSAAGSPLRSTELIELALQQEGHPDNGTASLLGGCTAAVPTPDEPEGALAVVQPPVHGSLHLAVAWPESPLYTPEARAALPEEVPFADAVENPRRLALLLEGLRTGDPHLLRLGVADRLHERFRRALIPGSDAAIQKAQEAGALAACLSGAGSGVVALGSADTVEGIAQAMAEELVGGTGLAAEICRQAPAVTLSPPSAEG